MSAKRFGKRKFKRKSLGKKSIHKKRVQEDDSDDSPGKGQTPYHWGKTVRKSYKLDKLRPLIVKCLMNGHSVRQTCILVGIDPQSFYNFKSRNDKFKKEVEDAVRCQINIVEDSLFEDCKKPGQVDAKKFFLTNRKPKSWANKTKEEVHLKEMPRIIYEDI